MRHMKIQKIFILGLVMLGFSACTDLDLEPQSTVNGAVVYDDPAAYKAVLARIYAGLSVSGQIGPAGDADIKGIDEGFSNYLRQYWKAQELTTDEAVIAWGDEGLPDYHEHSWNSSNQFVTAMYSRIFYQVSIANEFLRETTEDKLDERGESDATRAEVAQYRAEARFLRALSYWHGLDMFGNIPFATEENEVGSDAPEQVSKQFVFDFIESELLEIIEALPEAGQSQYGRVDRAAAWMVLAKLYLNAEVYINQDRYAESLQYAELIINSGAYSLDNTYAETFLADNQNSNETIFAVTFDGEHTQTWGGMTFLVHAAVGGDMDPAEFGVNGGWWGLRTTSSLVDLFPDETGTADKRAMFFTTNQTKAIGSITAFNDGYAITKYKNVTSDGNPGVDDDFVDTDFPMFRLSDVYLMYAEAHLRGGGGSLGLAVDYVNDIRQRGYEDNSGDITSGELTLDFILDERSRELYWEGHRRTDLIRFDQFTANGIWPWKGNVDIGVETETFRDLFPIPATELIANPKLEQNDGYQ